MLPATPVELWLVLAVTFGNAVQTINGGIVNRVVDVARLVAAVIPLHSVIEL